MHRTLILLRHTGKLIPLNSTNITEVWSEYRETVL